MATEILRPHDCIRNQFPRRISRSRKPNPNPNPNPKPGINQPSSCGRRKRSPSECSCRSCDSLPSPPPSRGLVMGQVKILKRGEELKAKILFGGENVDLGLQMCSTDQLGPDPDVVTKQITVPDSYAGASMMLSSPHPTSVPFPITLVKKNMAESDLRRLLKI